MNDLTLPVPLVEVNWLKEHLEHPDLVVLDATWFLPKFERSGKDEFNLEHISGAQFFDYDQEICDKNSEFPRMLPSAELFQNAVRQLGVFQKSAVVIYDNNGMFSSPRAWWMFNAMGFEKVAVLNGGLIEWKKAGLETTSEKNVVEEGDFIVQHNPDAFIDASLVLKRLENSEDVVIDARATERFDDAHMPGAKNLPYVDLLHEGKMKSIKEVTEKFRDLIDSSQKPTFSCGSGVTACVLALGAKLSGIKDLSIYDASWSEWGKDDKLPKATSHD